MGCCYQHLSIVISRIAHIAQATRTHTAIHTLFHHETIVHIQTHAHTSEMLSQPFQRLSFTATVVVLIVVLSAATSVADSNDRQTKAARREYAINLQRVVDERHRADIDRAIVQADHVPVASDSAPPMAPSFERMQNIQRDADHFVHLTKRMDHEFERAVRLHADALAVIRDGRSLRGLREPFSAKSTATSNYLYEFMLKKMCLAY